MVVVGVVVRLRFFVCGVGVVVRLRFFVGGVGVVVRLSFFVGGVGVVVRLRFFVQLSFFSVFYQSSVCAVRGALVMPHCLQRVACFAILKRVNANKNTIDNQKRRKTKTILEFSGDNKTSYLYKLFTDTLS